MKKTAIMIDAGFFMQRMHSTHRKYFSVQALTATHLMRVIRSMVNFHLKHNKREAPLELYRIYFYDCPPLEDQVRFPVAESGNKTPGRKNFKQDPVYKLRTELQEELRKSRKTALRLGQLSEHKKWQLKDYALKALIRGEKKWTELTNDDFYYEVKQKQVDIKLGMDITMLAYEKLVDVIVLVAGDADFVPAAKHARIKGIDFILNPLCQSISPTLSEHVDGIQSYNLKNALEYVFGTTSVPVQNGEII